MSIKCYHTTTFNGVTRCNHGSLANIRDAADKIANDKLKCWLSQKHLILTIPTKTARMGS